MISSLQNLRCLGSRVRVWSAAPHINPNLSNSHSNSLYPSETRHVLIFLHGSRITAFGMEKWLKSFWRPPAHTAIGERFVLWNEDF
jgi:hypothetical protein